MTQKNSSEKNRKSFFAVVFLPFFNRVDLPGGVLQMFLIDQIPEHEAWVMKLDRDTIPSGNTPDLELKETIYAISKKLAKACEVYVYDGMELIVITDIVYVEPLEEFPLTQKEALKGKGEETLPHPPGSRADHDIGIKIEEPLDIHRLIDVYRSPLPDTLKIEA